jgi:ribosomal protein S8
VTDTIENARQAGANVRRKAAETYDNSFAENLEKSGFLKELWGGEVPGKKW